LFFFLWTQIVTGSFSRNFHSRLDNEVVLLLVICCQSVTEVGLRMTIRSRDRFVSKLFQNKKKRLSSSTIQPAITRSVNGRKFVHLDPTQLNRQGNDVGDLYRSHVFVQNNDQEAAAFAAIERARGIWDDPIVTKISVETNFWAAEDYHNDYFAQNPEQAYCAMVVAPKVRKARAAFASLME